MASRKQICFSLLSSAIIIVGVSLRMTDVWRPVDGSTGTISNLWRETDVASIARNFYLEDNNVFFPRVLWRENTPGYTESEFPLYPWTVAQIYRVFGYNERYARLFSLIVSILTLYVLLAAARMTLSDTHAGQLMATAMFSLSPVLVYLATSIQSDTLMILFLAFSLFCYVKYTDSGHSRDLFLVAVWLSLAVLCKAIAIVYGLVFVVDQIRRRSFQGVVGNRSAVLAFFIVFLPNLAWAVHSHNFWVTNHLSLGVTNEGHLIGLDILFDREFYHGFLDNEGAFVFSYIGLGLVPLALYSIRKSHNARFLYLMFLSLLLFYFLTLYTTGARWAFYYHALSVPLAGLLMGAFFQVSVNTLKRPPSRFIQIMSTLFATLIGLALCVALNLSDWKALAFVSAATALAIIVARCIREMPNSRLVGLPKRINRLQEALQVIVVGTTAVVICALTVRSAGITRHDKRYREWFQCVKSLANFPSDARIATWGSKSHSAQDRAIAYNAPWVFFWMGRHGFSLPEDRQSIAQVDSVARLGAEFYVEFLPGSSRTPGFHESLVQEYPLVDSCGEFVLYQLK